MADRCPLRDNGLGEKGSKTQPYVLGSRKEIQIQNISGGWEMVVPPNFCRPFTTICAPHLTAVINILNHQRGKRR